MSPICAKPQPPFASNRHWRDDPRCSLSEASDLVPGKKRPEIILIGEAVAPGDSPAPSWTTRLAMASVDKRLDVYCERRWQPDGSLLAESPVRRVPLYWESAAGGPGTDNPPGWHPNSAPDEHGRRRAPRIQPHGSVLQHPQDPLLPAGYGPVAPQWRPRAIHLHHHIAHWSHEHWVASPIPADIDWAYFNAAPRDQQLDSLNSQDTLLLTNLIAGHPQLTTRLQAISPYLSLERASGTHVTALVCDTLWIDTVTATASLCWRATVQLTSADESVIAVFSEGASYASAALPGMDGISETAAADEVATAVEPFPLPPASEPSGARAAKATPTTLDELREAGAGAAIWPGSTDKTFSIEEVPADVAALLKRLSGKTEDAPNIAQRGADLTTTTAASSRDQDAPDSAVNEQGPGFPLAAPDDAAAPGGKSLDAIRGEGDAVHWSGPAEQTLHADEMPPDLAALLPRPRSTRAPLPRPPNPLAEIAPSPATSSIATPSESMPAYLGAAPQDEAEQPKASGNYAHVSEPSFLGPIATAEGVPQSAIAAHAEAAPEAHPEEESDAPAEEEPAESPLPLDAYPQERCAAITAALHCRPDEQTEILDSHQLDTELWSRLRAHYDEAFDRAIQRGKLAPIHAHDEAYVKQLEIERGPITFDEYVRLRIAAERGTRAATLQQLGLPEPSLMAVERVWLRRVTTDVRLIKKLDEAMKSARLA